MNTNTTSKALSQLEGSTDMLTALLRNGARQLIAQAAEAELAVLLEEHKAWQQRDLSKKRYVYFWADGIYSNVRMDDRLCLLVVMGVTAEGCKELIAVEDGYRESEASWLELLNGLVARGLTTSPKLATADGALGFWKALSKAYPQARQQRCWVHKTR